MATPTDKKEAALITVSLSGQLINAALTMIALSGAFFTFILDKKSPTPLFYILYIAAFLAFSASVYFGGRGTDAVRKSGEAGNWTSKPAGELNWFNLQSLSLLAAVCSLAILPFLGNTKTEYNESANLQRAMAKRDSLQSELFIKLLTTKPVRDTIYLVKPHTKTCKQTRHTSSRN